MTIPNWEGSVAAMHPENYSRIEAEWRAPRVMADDTLLFDECGRVLDNTCYRSHYFRLVKPRFGQYTLCVKHGGGEERIVIGYSARLVASLAQLDSDARYYMLHTLYRAHKEGYRQGCEGTASMYKAALVDGRLKKRKLRGQDGYKVWIEPRIERRPS